MVLNRCCYVADLISSEGKEGDNHKNNAINHGGHHPKNMALATVSAIDDYQLPQRSEIK